MFQLTLPCECTIQNDSSGFTHFQSYCETITKVNFIQFHLELGRQGTDSIQAYSKILLDLTYSGPNFCLISNFASTKITGLIFLKKNIHVYLLYIFLSQNACYIVLQILRVSMRGSRRGGGHGGSRHPPFKFKFL